MIITLYVGLSIKLKPYKRPYLNRLDIIQSIICLISIAIALLMYENDSELIINVSFYTLVIINLVFLAYLASIYIGSFIKNSRMKLKVLLDRLKTIIKPSPMNTNSSISGTEMINYEHLFDHKK